MLMVLFGCGRRFLRVEVGNDLQSVSASVDLERLLVNDFCRDWVELVVIEPQKSRGGVSVWILRREDEPIRAEQRTCCVDQVVERLLNLDIELVSRELDDIPYEDAMLLVDSLLVAHCYCFSLRFGVILC